MNKYLYFPIEVGARELLARCLTACSAAEQGFTTLIGYQYTLLEHATVFPKGIYFSKGSNFLSIKNMKMARDNGHVVAMCEEENFFRGLRGNPIVIGNDEIFDVCDLYVAVGQDEKDHLADRFGDSIPVVCCGNARADILRPELRVMFDERAANIRQKYGPHVLINTNLGIINNAMHGNAPSQIFDIWNDIDVFSTDLSKEERVRIFQDYIDFEEANTKAIRVVIEQLVQKGFTVLIRPHPVENIETWESIVRSINSPLAQVSMQDNHIPAILAADLVLHTACTTGVEALLLNVPALCISATQNEASSYHLARQFNATAKTAEEAVAAVEDLKGGSNDIADARPGYLEGMAHYLSAMEPGPFAADLIAEHFTRLHSNLSDRLKEGESPQTTPQILKESDEFTGGDYMRQKLGISPEAIGETVDALRSLLNRFHDIRCTQLSESVFQISR